jgi:hypothetical protein
MRPLLVLSVLSLLVLDASCSVEYPPHQGRKAATARDRGLSALPLLALPGVDRLLTFFTTFPFIPRISLHFVTPEL